MASISFAGRVAVVTGAGRGLGRAHALELASRGASIIANDVPDSTDLAETLDEILAAGGVAVAAYHSVSTAAGGAALIAQALAAFGRVDVLINNAGILRPGLFEDLSETAIDTVLAVHLKGAFNVTRPAFRAMRDAGYGRIVNTSSSSIFGFAGLTNYAAAKAGVLGLTTSLALEGEPFDIRVNAVLPAADTPMTADAQAATPIPGYAANAGWAETRAILLPRYDAAGVSALVATLASEACPVTGQAFSAMAGRYARVFLGIGEGWLAPDASQMTADHVLAHFDEIGALANFIAPAKSRDEFEATAKQIQAAS